MGVMAILVLGFVSLSRLPLDLLPNIEAPIVVVSTNYQNAGPREVENLVSKLVEEAMSSVSNVKRIRSISSRGNSVVIAEFDWGLDMDFVALDVREKVDLIKDYLPADADSPIIAKFDPNADPIMQLILRGDKSSAELRQAAEDLKSRFERIEGVGSVSVTGGLEREIKVKLHPGLMQAAGVSIETVSQILAYSNLNLPAGQILENNLEYILRTTGEFTSIEQIGKVRIPTSNNTLVRLEDIATIEDGYKESTQLSRYNGQPSVMISIQQEAGSNSVEVANQTLVLVEELNQVLASEGLTIEVAQDVTRFIKLAVDSVLNNAIVGGILAIIILFVFLRSVRPTLVIAVAIPISIIATFVLMYFADITLNMVSLGGLALGVGMLVDNSIVVLENIFRLYEEGYSVQEASRVGAEQMQTPIVASTLTTVSVFIPVIFVAGIAAEIFRDLALTVSFSLIASLVVSLTLVPMLASQLLSRGYRQESTFKPWLYISRFLENLEIWYSRVVKQVLDNSGLVVISAVLVLVLSYQLIQVVGMEFLPPMDQGEIGLEVTLPMGSRLEDTNQVMLELESYLAGLPEVDTISTQVGSGGLLGGGTHEGSIRIHLVGEQYRARSTDQIIALLRDYVRDIPEADIKVRMEGIFASYFGDPIQVELSGDDLELLVQVANDLILQLESIPGVQELHNSMAQGQPEIQIEIDRDKAANYGVTIGQIAASVRTAVSGTTVTRYRTEGNEIDVTVRLADDWRQDLRDVTNLPIQTVRGSIPLKEIAALHYSEGPISIYRLGKSRVVTINGQIYGRDLGSVMAEVKEVVANYDFPVGVSVNFGGEDEQMSEAFSQLFMAFMLGIVLVYMILAAQFESFFQPIVIMITIPLAAIGVVTGLLIGKVTFSVVGFIGAIMLAGIVVNNAIVFIDYINFLRGNGYQMEQAIIEAGRTRLRPVLMTTLTTVLGMVPLALGAGEGSELQQPIALVVIGGLTTSTLLTLFVLPVFYRLIESLVSGSAFRRQKKAREC